MKVIIRKSELTVMLAPAGSNETTLVNGTEAPEESLEESILTILTSSNSTNLTRDSLDEAFCRDVEAFSEAFQVKPSTLLCNISLLSGW